MRTIKNTTLLELLDKVEVTVDEYTGRIYFDNDDIYLKSSLDIQNDKFNCIMFIDGKDIEVTLFEFQRERIYNLIYDTIIFHSGEPLEDSVENYLMDSFEVFRDDRLGL